MSSHWPAFATVLLYLQGMDANPPEDDDGRSNVTTSEVVRSSRAKSKAASSVRQLSQLGGEENPAEDIRSDVQEHASELGRTIPIHTTGIVSTLLPHTILGNPTRPRSPARP